jgi:hypothetical protein
MKVTGGSLKPDLLVERSREAHYGRICWMKVHRRLTVVGSAAE